MMLATVGGAVLKQRRRYTAPFSGGGGGGVPSWVSALSMLTWHQVPNTSLQSAMGSYSSPGGSKQGITAYAGMAYTPSGDIYSTANGGHSDYAGNESIRIRLGIETPGATLLRAPSTSVQNDVSHYSDGKPSSAHSGFSLQYIAALNRIFRFGAGNTWGNGNGYNVIDAWDIAGNDWDAQGTWPTGGLPFASDNVVRCVAKDANEDVWMSRTDTGDIYKWTRSTGTLSFVAQRSGYSYGVPWAHDPVRNRLVRFSATQGARFDPTNNCAETAVSFSGVTAGVQRYLTALWCPDRGTFLTMPWEDNAPAVYEVDPVTFAVSSLSIAGTQPPAAPANGYGWLPNRFGYLADLKLCFYMADYSTNIWVFRTG